MDINSYSPKVFKFRAYSNEGGELITIFENGNYWTYTLSEVRDRINKNETGTVDWSPVEEHNKRIQDGLDLFAKHFRSLWD